MKKGKRRVLLVLFVIVITIALRSWTAVFAANFTEALVRLDRVKASTASGGTVCAKPVSTGTEGKIAVTFPTGFTVGTTAASWTVDTTNTGWPTLATAWPGILTATGVSGQTVTFPSGELTVGTLYCFNFAGTSTLTTSAAGANKRGTVATQTSGAVVIDSSDYSTAVISNDQIVITAVVPQIFNFILTGNTDSFTSNLSPTTITSTLGIGATFATNASNGWHAWVKSTNLGLLSATTGEKIDTTGSVDNTPSTLASGTNGYVLDVDLSRDGAGGSGIVTIAGEYNGANTSQGGTLSNVFQPIATANGTTDGDALILIGRATINAVTAAAADYTDTLTIVAAGRF